MSQLIEEKSNKIIEIIAAAMPIDAMFVGKLFAMLAASVIGLIVWIGAGALFIQMIKHGGVAALPAPAVGWPGFLGLAILYFAMNYLLIGALMLTIGAQASTRARSAGAGDARDVRPVPHLRLCHDRDRRAGFGVGPGRRDLPFVLADGDARARRAGTAMVAAPRRRFVAGDVGRADPPRRRPAVPQDRAEIGAARQMVALAPRLADRRARHFLKRGHQRAVREGPVADPRDSGLGPDFLVRRAREGDDVERQRHFANHALDLLRV